MNMQFQKFMLSNNHTPCSCDYWSTCPSSFASSL